MCVHLEQDVCAHSLAVSDNGLLVLSFSIPAIKLYAPGRNEGCGMQSIVPCITILTVFTDP